MKLEEKNGLRILTCDFGYMLHNKITDTYSSKVYLGKFASIDDYEEVIDETINRGMIEKIQQIDDKIINLEQDMDLINVFNEIINE